jgi:hypothetical protein
LIKSQEEQINLLNKRIELMEGMYESKCKIIEVLESEAVKREELIRQLSSKAGVIDLRDDG